MAGLKKVKLLKEPEAAALAYGLLQRQPQLVLVFDLGGGTFDVSVLEVGGGLVEVFDRFSTKAVHRLLVITCKGRSLQPVEMVSWAGTTSTQRL